MTLSQPASTLTPSVIVECEYLVIGSGAGGSVAARELARAGHDVLVLEEGPLANTAEFGETSLSNLTRKLYRNGGIQPFLGKPTIGFGEGSCVGGSTVVNGGLIWRTPERFLDHWKTRKQIHGYGTDDLTPHFEKIEQALGVQHHTFPDTTNLDSQALENGCNALGWKIVPVPRALNGCVQANQCGAGCPSGGKQSMLVSYLPDAVSHGARIFHGARVTQLHQSRGNITHVSAQIDDDGGTRQLKITPRFVILAAGAIQTPFLIRKSGIKSVAGNRLEFHINLRFAATFREPINAQQGTIFTTQVQEFIDDDLLIMATNYRPSYVAAALAHFDNTTLQRFMDNQDHGGLFVAQVRPDCTAQISTRFGKNPVVKYQLSKQDIIKIRDAMEKTAELLFASGATEIYLPIQNSASIATLDGVRDVVRKLSPKALQMISVHAMASCAMGIEENSAVDTNGKVLGVDNLFVCDASVLPSNIGESPQGTIMAIAHEIIDRHLQQ
ncbi:MAG: FAD-dependent oxidoreductase [Alphaproteobacteria bacterium]|nr:FAD-dependent oxidoreductase [Alphaproteobacteria bacterium]